MMSIHVLGRIAKETIHDSLLLRIETVDDWRRRKATIAREDDNLELRISHVLEKVVHRRTLLETPPCLILKETRKRVFLIYLHILIYSFYILTFIFFLLYAITINSLLSNNYTYESSNLFNKLSKNYHFSNKFLPYFSIYYQFSSNHQ